MAIELEKREAKVKIILEKNNITNAPVLRVGFATDVSGSAKGLYYSQPVMQETIDRLLAVATRFDDNGEMDMWAFDTSAYNIPVATKADYGGYVNKHIVGNRNIGWGGTHYAPVMQRMIDHYFPKAQLIETKETKGFFGFGKKTETVTPVAEAGIPALGIIVTDGENYDKPATKRLLEGSQNQNIYWLFVGVGDPDYFTFIEEMADLLPNVGFVSMASLAITDEQLYEGVINPELCTWVKKF